LKEAFISPSISSNTSIDPITVPTANNNTQIHPSDQPLINPFQLPTLFPCPPTPHYIHQISNQSNDASIALNILNISNQDRERVLERLGPFRSLRNIQNDIMTIFYEQKWATFIQRLRDDPNLRAPQFLAYYLSAMKDPYTWNTTPSHQDTTMSNRQFTVALTLRLLEPLNPFIQEDVSSLNLYCPVCCSVGSHLSSSTSIASMTDIDPFGYHVWKCNKNGYQTRTKYIHDILVDLWTRMLNHSGCDHVRKEPAYCFTSSNKRPDGSWNSGGGVTSYFDVRTCDPLLKDIVYKACDTPGIANIEGQMAKDSVWYNLIHSQNDKFIPICHEYPGAMGDPAYALLNASAARFSSSIPQQSIFKSFWLSRFHLAVARGKADHILERMPTYSDSPQNHPYSPTSTLNIPAPTCTTQNCISHLPTFI
jgi:hypothetical protein